MNFFTDTVTDIRLEYVREFTALLCRYGDEDNNGDLMPPRVEDTRFAAFSVAYTALRRRTAHELQYVRRATLADREVIRLGY